MRWLLAIKFAVPLSIVFLVVLLLGVVTVLVDDDEQQSAPTCGSAGGGATVDPASVPTDAVAGYVSDQLVNAALIVDAGAALGLSAHGQTIGVMTAMGESTLKVIDYGDAAGPDSRGLFQQRANGVWGSYADRMDPTISATNFYKALMTVPNWETLTPTAAAHRTQRNADPNYYTRFWEPAVQVMVAVAGIDPATLSTGGAVEPCTPEFVQGGTLADGVWTKPAIGPFTSGYGPRWGTSHNGVDLAPPCAAPIFAAASGVVVRAGPSTGYGNLINVDHGSGVVTRYAHMFDPDVLVTVGQPVAGGQQIARVGTKGDSTGCHLHYEVQLNGAFTNPAPFMSSRNVPLT